MPEEENVGGYYGYGQNQVVITSISELPSELQSLFSFSKVTDVLVLL